MKSSSRVRRHCEDTWSDNGRVQPGVTQLHFLRRIRAFERVSPNERNYKRTAALKSKFELVEK